MRSSRIYCRQRLCLLSPKFTNYPNTDTSLSKCSLLHETTRATRLFARCTTARKSLFHQPNPHKVFNYFLRTEIIAYHEPDSLKLSTDPILSLAAILETGPSVKAQGSHRDDFLWQQTHTVPRGKYSGGSDVSMGLLILVSNLVSSGQDLGSFCHLAPQLLR